MLHAPIDPFSCGIPVPTACKASGKVTMIGQTSGGDSCMVLPCTTASGALFRVSGPGQRSIIMNEGFYNIDTGVEPYVVLNGTDSMKPSATVPRWRKTCTGKKPHNPMNK